MLASKVHICASSFSVSRRQSSIRRGAVVQRPLFCARFQYLVPRPLPVCRSSPPDSETTTTEPQEDTKIKKTISDLDALLGIDPDDPKGLKKSPKADADKPSISISADALKAIATAEAQRLAGGDASKQGDMENVISDQMKRILEKAKAMADEQNKRPGEVAGNQEALKQEFEQLLTTLFKPESGLDKDDIKKLKDTVFGPQTFWVTETVPIPDIEKPGVLIRGNLRDTREKVFDLVAAKVKELFDGKYEVVMVEDPEQDENTNVKMGPRVAFQILPTAAALPPQTTGWKQAVSFLLSLLFIASCLNLALTANITKLPKETLEYFADPNNDLTVESIPGLENFDPAIYFSTVLPVFGSVIGINVMHELGHRLAALIRNVRLGPTYFVPSFQIGTFGAITPFTSLLKNRKDMWDVAFAGPLAGSLMSLSLLTLGLLASDPDVVPKELLIPVPTQLFQGSVLLGTITKFALGDTAMRSSEVLVNPVAIAGWCGLVTNSLNLLPVGSLDGGRMVQAAYGRQALALSSFFCYVGLGLGFLGGTLALPFGLYVLICQRSAEQYIQDNVTPADGNRPVVTAVAVITAILILLPFAPELADAFGVGPSDRFNF